jgi:hypothetical protein
MIMAAKLVGVGLATIALAGAAIRVGPIFAASIFVVVGNMLFVVLSFMTVSAVSYPFIAVWLATPSVHVWLLFTGVSLARADAYPLYTICPQPLGAGQLFDWCS